MGSMGVGGGGSGSTVPKIFGTPIQPTAHEAQSYNEEFWSSSQLASNSEQSATESEKWKRNLENESWVEFKC